LSAGCAPATFKPAGNLTASGATSGLSITATGSATNATHAYGGGVPRHSGSSGYPAIY